MEQLTRIVFECGPTHSGLDEALKLVEAAKGAIAFAQAADRIEVALRGD